MEKIVTLPRWCKITFVCLLLSTIGLGVSTGVLYKKVYNLEHPEVLRDKELSKLIAEIGKFVYLPENEEATLATVTDPEKLKDQPFFAHAQAGDKVIVYATSRKAILWRPSTKKIIEISGLNLSDTGK